MQRNFTIFFFFILLLNIVCLTSCNLGNGDDKETVVSVVTEFNVDLFESLDFATPTFELIVTTTDDKNCKNYSIDYDILRGNTKIIITLNDIIPPLDCITEPAPASSVIDLGYLPINRTFKIEINIKDAVVNKGTITVANDSYLLEMETMDGINLVNKELLRIPANTIWGFVGYQDGAEVDGENENFIKDLEIVTEEKSFQQGYYGYFSINLNDQIVLDNPSGFLHFEPFLLNLTEDKAVLSQLLDTYRMPPIGSAMTIKIFTWEGEEF